MKAYSGNTFCDKEIHTNVMCTFPLVMYYRCILLNLDDYTGIAT